MLPEIPAGYITNQVDFLDVNLLTQQGTFTPKKQIEFLVAKVMELISENFGMDKHLNIIDMCTGIGNIAVALALKLTRVMIRGVDICEKAIETAKKNADILHLNHRIKFEKGDLFEPVEYLRGQTDLIVCNPPYIPSGQIKYLDKSITEHDPLKALDGGLSGLSFFIKIISLSFAYLRQGGFLAFEVGGEQGKYVVRLIQRKERYSDPAIIPCPYSDEEFVTCRFLG